MVFIPLIIVHIFVNRENATSVKDDGGPAGPGSELASQKLVEILSDLLQLPGTVSDPRESAMRVHAEREILGFLPRATGHVPEVGLSFQGQASHELFTLKVGVLLLFETFQGLGFTGLSSELTQEGFFQNGVARLRLGVVTRGLDRVR
jgi:hypothetical protein